MRLAVPSLLIFGCAILCAQTPAPPRGASAPARSPEVGPDRRVTFRLRAPAAKESA